MTQGHYVQTSLELFSRGLSNNMTEHHEGIHKPVDSSRPEGPGGGLEGPGTGVRAGE
jgi:hypothetical protein